MGNLLETENSTMAMPEYLDFEIDGGDRLNAISALWRFYPNYSFKRKLLKGVNGINQLSFRISSKKMRKIAHAEDNLPRRNNDGTRAFLLHKLDQNGRVYIFDQDINGKLVTVTKLALTETAAKGLRWEAHVLDKLAGRTLFKIPSLILFKSWEEGCLVQISAAPEHQSVYNKNQEFPEALLKAVAALVPLNAAKTLPAECFVGWQSARVRTFTPAIREIADQIKADDHFDTAAAHRDLGSENIFCGPNSQDVSDFTIIDWEFFSESAPAMTDCVGLWLGRHHRAFKGFGGLVKNDLATAFISQFTNTPGGKKAAVLALLHLADMGIDLAQYLIGDRK